MALRAPPPIVLAQSNWRAHLDCTPVPAWLRHYDFEGFALRQLQDRSFRELYALSADDARQMLGRRVGERLMACTRAYARAVQQAYTQRARQRKDSNGHQQHERPRHTRSFAESPSAAAGASSALPLTERPVNTGPAALDAVKSAQSTHETAARRIRRSKNGRAAHAAFIEPPPDGPLEALVFVPPPTFAAPAASALPVGGAIGEGTASAAVDSASPPSPRLTTRLLLPEASVPVTPATATVASVRAAHTAVAPGSPATGRWNADAFSPASAVAVSSIPPPVSTAAVSSRVLSTSALSSSSSISQSSSASPLVLLTDTLLDRSNAWIKGSAFLSALFTEQSGTTAQQALPHSASSAPSFSSAHSRLVSSLGATAVLQPLEPQPF